MRDFKQIVLCALILTLAGCAPKISEKERQKIQENSTPVTRDSGYTQGLERMGRVINTGLGVTSFAQVQSITNKAGAAKLQEEVTDMVLNSVDMLAGRLFQVIPEYAEYLPSNAKPIHNELQPQKPDIVVTGAITEFDQDISEKDSETGLEGYIPSTIEGEEVDTDIMASFSRAESISRIAIDLRLMDYNSKVILPRMHVSNTILVFELEKQRNLGFMIYGSGLSRTGSVSMKQGLHQAVRNLIDYSVLQLFGMYYSVPYWRTLGNIESDKSDYWLSQWRQNFIMQQKNSQIGQVQLWLTRYSLDPVYINGVMVSTIPREEYGKFGKVSQAFTLQFLYQYAPNSPLISYAERSNFPQNGNVLGDLYLTLIKNIPMT